jgi:DNA-binding NtrC family response regulator
LGLPPTWQNVQAFFSVFANSGLPYERVAHTTKADGEPAHSRLGYPLPDEGISLEESERNLIARALEKTRSNQTQAARLLSITRDTLRYKMKKFNLK